MAIETDAKSTSLALERMEHFADRVRKIRASLHEVVVGQDEVIDHLLLCALTGSHALLVGVPGLAKTLMIKALAAARLHHRPMDAAVTPRRGFLWLPSVTGGSAAPTPAIRVPPLRGGLSDDSHDLSRSVMRRDRAGVGPGNSRVGPCAQRILR